MRGLALARPVVARLFRSPRTLLAIGTWYAVGVALALTARAHGSSQAANHVLIGAFGAFLLPLLAYTLVGGALGTRSLSASGAPLVAFGPSPFRVAGVSLAVAMLATALASAALAVGLALLAHGTGDPPLGRDVIATAYVGSLGGAAYASFLSLGASFGRRGGGRAVFLVVDWLLGGAGGVLSPVCPRAHVSNLLGGAAPLDLPERASSVALVVLGLGFALVAALRAGRRGQRFVWGAAH